MGSRKVVKLLLAELNKPVALDAATKTKEQLNWILEVLGHTLSLPVRYHHSTLQYNSSDPQTWQAGSTGSALVRRPY
jgi:hypothetical protein